MAKVLIVISKDGFMSSKKPEEVLETDEVIAESYSEEETEQIIHGQYRTKL